jgi:hypothetical protein
MSFFQGENKLLKILILGSIFYILVHALLYSKLFETNELINKYRKYIYYIAATDFALFFLMNDSSNQSKEKTKEITTNDNIDDNQNQYNEQEQEQEQEQLLRLQRLQQLKQLQQLQQLQQQKQLQQQFEQLPLKEELDVNLQEQIDNLAVKQKEITEKENSIRDDYKSLCDKKLEFTKSLEEKKLEFIKSLEEKKIQFDEEQKKAKIDFDEEQKNEKIDFDEEQKKEKIDFDEELETMKNSINDKILEYNEIIKEFNEEQTSLQVKLRK